MVTTINQPINQSGAQVATAIDSLQTQITNSANLITGLTNSLAALTTRTTLLESEVATLQNQVANLISRVNTISTNPVWAGPLVGVLVHLKNKDGDCTAAIIYEDSTKRNDPDTISVVYVDPDSPNWFSRRDVHEAAGPDLPFNSWHIPEFNYVASAPINLRRMVA